MNDETPVAATAPISQVLYVSEALAGPDEVAAIVQTAQRRNAAAALSGALLYSGGHFVQVLEGPAAALETTLQAIAADPRHRAMRVLLRRVAPRRGFEAWRMALLGFDGGDELARSLLVQDATDEARALRLLERLERLAREPAPPPVSPPA